MRERQMTQGISITSRTIFIYSSRLCCTWTR